MSTPHTELTNLLPRYSIRALRREDFIRVATVALGLGVLVIIAHGILLFPAYLYARSEVKREQAELDSMTASATSAQEKEISARITSVQEDIEFLGRLNSQPTASGAVRALLATPHTGISLTGFTFTAPKPASKSVC